MAGVERLEQVSIDLLKPYERNAKKHPQSQLDVIAKSIQELGFLSPCLIDEEYNLIAGHGRVAAAKQIGLKSVPCVFVEGLTEEQRRAYILADNKLTELGEWDMELVQQELSDLQGMDFDISITGFGLDDLEIDDIDDGDFEAGVGSSEAEETRVKSGELWQLGPHYLMCGDSTDFEDVEKLMKGEKADLLVTDPPYGVAYVGWTGMTIENDDLDESGLDDLLSLAFANASESMNPGAGFYIFCASSLIDVTIDCIRKTDLLIKQHIIWVKDKFVMGRQDYQWRHEPAIYGWKDGAAHYFVEKRNLTTVIEDPIDLESKSRDELIEMLKSILDENANPTTAIHEDRPMVNEEHPTMKPVPLIARLVKNSSKPGDIVLDLFGGSGTTLLACEELGRNCRIMELDPHYADVIVKRWEKQTGQEAHRVG